MCLRCDGACCLDEAGDGDTRGQRCSRSRGRRGREEGCGAGDEVSKGRVMKLSRWRHNCKWSGEQCTATATPAAVVAAAALAVAAASM